MNLPDPPSSYKPSKYTSGKVDQDYHLTYRTDNSGDRLPIDGLCVITLPKITELKYAYDRIIHIENAGRRFSHWTEGFSADFVNLIKAAYKVNIWKGMK